MDEGASFSFTPKGLQHLVNRASLRLSIADHEGDEEEANMAVAELMAFAQLVEVYGWHMVDGTILEVEEDG
jgi:hypothetical protein